MLQMFPSQVVAFIDKTFKMSPSDPYSQHLNLTGVPIRGSLLALVGLVERIPSHLIIDESALTDVILVSNVFELLSERQNLQRRQDSM